MKRFTSLDLSDEEIDAIRKIIDDFEREDRAIRDRQIRDWKRLELMWNGYNNIYWDYVAHDWRTWGNGSADGGADDNQAGYYDKNINVFRAYGETIIAALSATVPPIKCIPDDADVVNDCITARGGTRIGELIYNHIDAPLLWVRCLWIYYLQGMVAAYNYTDEDESYGSVDVRDTKTETVDGQQTVCSNCGHVLMERELSDEIKKQELDEYDPNNDDIKLHSLLSDDSKILCPQCEIEMDPELKQDKITVTRLTGMTRQLKTHQCIDIEGGLYVKIPNWAKDQKDMPYIFYDRETHFSNILAEFPDLLDDEEMESIDCKSDGNGNDLYERWGRLNPQYRGEFPLNTPTLKRRWLRSSAFNSIVEKTLRNKLRKKFPDGCYVILVNDVYIGACNESLDDHWTIMQNPMSNYATFDATATLVTAVQEITSNLIALQQQCIEHSIPQTFFNPKFLNSEQYRNTEVAPGSMYPTKTIGENRNISDGFHTLQTATVSGEVDAFGDKINSLGEFVSGALPQVYGGSSGGGSSRTASQYAMQRNGAQIRLSSLTGRNVNFFWKSIFSKVIPAYMKEMLEDERIVKPVRGSDTFEQTIIKKSQMDGKIGDYRLEAPEGLPETLDQIKETVMSLIQTNNPEILQAVASPENLPILAKTIGLNDFIIPGEADREKQLEEIGILLNSGPMPSGQQIDPNNPQTQAPQETSSVQPELLVDNHAIEAEICRNWLVSEKGRQAKTDNADGYKNILLHLSEHMQMMQQLQSGQVQNQNNQPKPETGTSAQQPKDNVRQLRPVSRQG